MKTVGIGIFFLINILALLSSCEGGAENQMNTVEGPVERAELGMALTHEHIMSNFGKEISETPNYDSTQLFLQVIPYQ